MSASTPIVHIKAHRAQMDFVSERSVPYMGYVGGRGSGKSFAGSMKLYKSSLEEPGLYGMYNATYPLLNDTTVRSFKQVAKAHIKSHNESKNIFKMYGGSEIICRSLDDPENARGPSLRGALWDEASLCKETAFSILIGCLRYEGKQGWLACTFTSKGKNNWTTKVFNDPTNKDVKVFHSSTYDNPFNPPGFADLLRRQYTTTYSRREIDGLFVSIEGKLMKREWFKIVPTAPPLSVICRFWDMAATVPSEATPNPDFTAGPKVGRTTTGQWIILDMRRDRISPMANESLISQTALVDGRQIMIRMEQEPGASGKSLIEHYTRTVLSGYNFKGVPSTGDKITRALPLAAAAEHGNVMLLAGAWNEAFLDEVETFGGDDENDSETNHDDQVDAVAGAFNVITGKRKLTPHVGGSANDSEIIIPDATEFADILAAAKTPEERDELVRMLREEGIKI